MTDLTRRKFIQLSVLGSAITATGLTSGCKNERIYKLEVAGRYGGESNIVDPYVNQPDGLQTGVPQYFATTCAMCPAGCGLMIRSMGGRAVKVEGNPAHPVNSGRSCARGQAALQHLYNPDRLRFPIMRGKRDTPFDTTDWDTALAQAANAFKGGKSAIVVDATTIGRSPSEMKLVSEFAAKNNAKLFQFGLLDDSPWRKAAQAVYGKAQIPAYELSEADCIVAFNANFLEAWPSPVYYGAQFGEFRQGPRRSQGEHGRFFYIGPRMSMTAAKSDRWIPCNPGTEGVVAAAIASALTGNSSDALAQAVSVSGVSAADIQLVANAVKTAGTRAVAMAGDGLISQKGGYAAISTVESINTQIGSQCVGFGSPALPLGDVNPPIVSHIAQMQNLINGINSGAVQSVLFIGQSNPVFTLSRAYGLQEALERASFVAAITPFEDETTAYADVVFPARTFLESYGDSIPYVIPAGQKAASLRQPIIDPDYIRERDVNNVLAPNPWMNARETMNILIDLANQLGKPLKSGADSRDVVRRTWATIGQATLSEPDTDNDRPWVNALSIGGFYTSGAKTPNTFAAKTVTPVSLQTSESAPAPDAFFLHLYPHLYWGDGRNSNLGWMQELPDPMTSAVWNTWIELNLQTAERMGIRTGDIVRITTQYGYLDAPAVPSPGIHPNALAMPIGNGHAPGVYGRNPRGHNPLVILDPQTDATSGALVYSAAEVSFKKIRDAKSGWNGPNNETLVLVQDRPGGSEPDAVKNLIHTTARDWKKGNPITPVQEPVGSIFHRSRGETQSSESK